MLRRERQEALRSGDGSSAYRAHKDRRGPVRPRVARCVGLARAQACRLYMAGLVVRSCRPGDLQAQTVRDGGQVVRVGGSGFEEEGGVRAVQVAEPMTQRGRASRAFGSGVSRSSSATCDRIHAWALPP